MAVRKQATGKRTVSGSVSRTTRKSCRDRTLDLIQHPRQFPFWTDEQKPHKIGHAVRIPSPPGVLVKVECDCFCQWWTTKVGMATKRGRKCFVCGGRRVEV